MTPEQQVGNAANLTIFLGILYSFLNVAALLGRTSLAARGFGVVGLGVALAIIVLGYGIRQGAMGSLYAATGLFALFTAYSLMQLQAHANSLYIFRLILSGWVMIKLFRAIPAMKTLHETHSKPVQSSRYGDFFLRRGKKSDIEDSSSGSRGGSPGGPLGE